MTNPAVRLLTRIDRAAGGLAADLFLYALSTAFAALTAATSTLLPHRAWGAIAAWAYAVATLAVAVQLVVRVRPLKTVAARAALTWSTWVAAALLPLIVQAVQRAAGRADRAQEEVLVVERMGDRLLHNGTPYLGRDTIAALPADERLAAYSPYQPGMSVFGLPRAVFGDFWWTDARVWFAAVTAAALITAVRVLRTATPSLMVRAIQAAAVLPICALTLATGGDDIPVLALCLLALALTATARYGWAGAAVGAAAACKLFAFPVVAVLVVLAFAAHRAGRLPGHASRLLPAPSGQPLPTPSGQPLPNRSGQPLPAASGQPLPAPSEQPLPVPSGQFLPDRFGRLLPRRAGWLVPGNAGRLLPGALGLPLLALLPPLLVDPDAFVENVIRFPMGHGLVTSPAQSPFPGYLIAQNIPGGRLLAAALLAAVAAAIAVRLIRRPPRTAAAASLICGWGLLAAILLMPTTRFGYLLYPIAFLVWAPALATATAATHAPSPAPADAPPDSTSQAADSPAGSR